MIKYIGSKRRLVPTILRVFDSLAPNARLLDLFSGTCRVGHAAKRCGYEVAANDHNEYAYVLATCYVQADANKYREEAGRIIDYLNHLQPTPGYFTETFCIKSRFFQPKNGEKIDAIREWIEDNIFDFNLKAILLTSLIEAADRVDSTTGVQMAYLKKWAPRSYNDLFLRLPAILPGEGQATRLDALDAVRHIDCDIVYLDPPYNQHSYLGNYHIWETLVKWDKPDFYGVACKRIDCRSYKSPFNSKRQAYSALKKVVDSIQAPHIVISFNNEGYIERQQIEHLLESIGMVATLSISYDRYVGAKIGIYNPKGDKVGKVSHTKNKEYLYIVSKDEAAFSRINNFAAMYAEDCQQSFQGFL
ncbi:MAG: DNA methyltransferase [Methanobacteriota archaeon]|nr:MAG: DNA methyltransferase [Euryarchaeota archaeon]